MPQNSPVSSSILKDTIHSTGWVLLISLKDTRAKNSPRGLGTEGSGCRKADEEATASMEDEGAAGALKPRLRIQSAGKELPRNVLQPRKIAFAHPSLQLTGLAPSLIQFD